MENRVETQAQAAKRNLKTAYESGDPEAMAEAQQMLARAEADRNALAKYRQDLSDYKVQYDAWLDQQSQQAQQDPEMDFLQLNSLFTKNHLKERSNGRLTTNGSEQTP